jgi:hypothetical protein
MYLGKATEVTGGKTELDLQGEAFAKSPKWFKAVTVVFWVSTFVISIIAVS